MENKKVNLFIEDFEHKVSRDGKTNYTRFKTNEGWMACFDKALIDDVVKAKGKTLECEITEDEKKRKVLQAVVGYADEEATPPKEIDVTPEKSDNRNTTMYTSYAKDIFIGLITGIEPDGIKSCGALMNNAITLVKQARDAFS